MGGCGGADGGGGGGGGWHAHDIAITNIVWRVMPTATACGLLLVSHVSAEKEGGTGPSTTRDERGQG